MIDKQVQSEGEKTIKKIKWYHKTSESEGDDQERKHKKNKSEGDNKHRECSMGYFYFLPFLLSLFIPATASFMPVLFPFNLVKLSRFNFDLSAFAFFSYISLACWRPNSVKV